MPISKSFETNLGTQGRLPNHYAGDAVWRCLGGDVEMIYAIAMEEWRCPQFCDRDDQDIVPTQGDESFDRRPGL